MLIELQRAPQRDHVLINLLLCASQQPQPLGYCGDGLLGSLFAHAMDHFARKKSPVLGFLIPVCTRGS